MTECGRSLQLHRVIAVNVSKKLSAELAAKPTATELHVRNVKYSALEKLLDFIYSGKVLLSNPNDLQDFADAYNVLIVNLGEKVNKMINNIITGEKCNEIESSFDEKIELKCRNCDKTFKTKTLLKRHVREVHMKDQIEKKTYACEQCSQVYTVSSKYYTRLGCFYVTAILS